MKTRILHTKIWKDSYFRSLSPNEKILFVYLLTNEYINQIWLYECSSEVICFETGLKSTEVEKIKTKLQSDSKIAFFKDYIFLINANKYETYKGEMNDKAKEKILKYLSSDVLDWYNNILHTPIHTPIHTPQIPSINNKEEIISNKEGVIGGEILVTKSTLAPKEPTIPERLINLFNRKTGRVYKLTDGRKKQINLRLKTFTPEEIAQAITKMLEMPFYRGENNRRWEADPDFILRNDEQIDKFLGKTKQLQVDRLSDLIK